MKVQLFVRTAHFLLQNQRNLAAIFLEAKIKYVQTRSLGALRAPTSRLRPFGPALGPSGLLDNVLHALRALRPCDPRNSAMMG